MKKRLRAIYLSKHGWREHLKTVRRRKDRQRIRAGIILHEINMKRHAEKNGRIYSTYKSGSFRAEAVQMPANINFLSSIPELFSTKRVQKKDSGYFLVPKCFSLLDHYEESFDFLKRLFFALCGGKTERITLDYAECERIDVDASICMDLMLADIINHVYKCRRKGHRKPLPALIRPINYQRDEIEKKLFSIGAYRNIKGLVKHYSDVEPLAVLINQKSDPKVWEKNELHLTQIVEYIKRCLHRMNRELTVDAETEFYQVIGEVMSNAEEHGTMDQRFAIGCFQQTHNDEGDFGVFNFCIFNYGDTIYQTFKSPHCKNPKAVQEMKNLSEEYTKKGWFRSAEFEEETLWTLYALQQGVTSKEKKRGNGSIAYIENFFSLADGNQKKGTSKLILHSGHTRILVDGSYDIVKKFKEGDRRPYKMITFNKSGEIADKPDKNFVTFVPHFFPGTLISARILITFDNTNAKQDGTQDI